MKTLVAMAQRRRSEWAIGAGRSSVRLGELNRTFLTRRLFSRPEGPSHVPWTFGVMDRQHLVLILSTSATAPMVVDWVRVWQSP